MTTATSNQDKNQLRTYHRAGSAVFLKTKEKYGGLSNMAGGFPLIVNDIKIRTSEALYQACRFPHIPEIQRLIIGQRSPMTAKMKGKPHRQNSRPDWDAVRVKIMRWCLRVKLAQNWDSFSERLLSDFRLISGQWSLTIVSFFLTSTHKEGGYDETPQTGSPFIRFGTDRNPTGH